ncbi:MAG TPA: cation:proton antiporter [Marmoricola sp.]|jgi:potassium/hydrogen antiporter
MHDVNHFAVVLLFASAAVLLAVASSRLGRWLPVPGPALFLLAASVCAQVFPELSTLPIRVDQRIVTVAVVVILFDGGLHIGLARFRPVAGPVVWLGVAGTFVTAAGLALACHSWFGFDWRAALLLGTALAPTDPAMVFSVLGRREVGGRSGTLLEGESGANDPVGIALMVSILGSTSGGVQALGHGAVEFLLQMCLGAAFGVAGGFALRWLLRHLPLPNEAFYPLRAVAFAVLLYAVTTVAHGSGFLAVLLAGILAGDTRAPYKREVERFSSASAGLAEIVAFTVLGLSMPLSDAVGGGRGLTALGVAFVLILLVRPILVGVVLLPVRLRRGERAFVLWSGLKGVVPILLGTYILAEGGADAPRLYAVIFVVVVISVVLQGALIPTLARVWRIPLRTVEPEPWAVGMRFRAQPEGLHRYVVQTGSAAAGVRVRDLPIGEDLWISVVSRAGHMVQVSGNTTLQAGDEVLAITSDETTAAQLFRGAG